MAVKSKGKPAVGPLKRAKLKQKSRQPRFAALLALTFSGMVVALVVLAGQTDVPQITRAPGTIIPFGNYPQIETMEGGIVQAVHVQDGETVEAGDILVELHHPDLKQEQEVLSKQLAAVNKRLGNVTAVLSALNRNTEVSAQQIQALRTKGYSNAAAALDLYTESQRIQKLSITQQEDMLSILSSAVTFARERVQKKDVNLQRLAKLQSQGLKPLGEYLEEEDRVDALRAAASASAVQLAQAQNTLTLAQAALAEETLSLREAMLKQLVELEQEQEQLGVSLDVVTQKLASLRLVAPAGGIVQSASHPNTGEIIEPGETLFELLPTQRALVVEARIPSLEVGHVGSNHPVTVSIDTYDVRRFGKVEGRLQSISPLPLIDEQTGETYFRASMVLADGSVGAGPMERPLQAGMTVVAEMTTGEQTLLAYMLKPVQLTMERAFNER